MLGEEPDEDFDHRLDVVPAGLAKGLSSTRWCCSSRPRSSPPNLTWSPGLRRLYVCLTRAVSGLQVVHADPLPVELAGDVA